MRLIDATVPTFGQWISADDRKPKVNEPVLIALYGEVFEGFYVGHEVWCEGTEDCYFEIDDPEAWMPMPEPPEVE